MHPIIRLLLVAGAGDWGQTEEIRRRAWVVGYGLKSSGEQGRYHDIVGTGTSIGQLRLGLEDVEQNFVLVVIRNVEREL